jgi:tRNA A-37 threonylcarbamoyl transferase component Bud32
VQRAPSSAGEDLVIGSFAGEYRIECKLGQGGMAAVYGARHPVIGKRAAIKVIAPDMSANRDAVDRFVREAQAVNQIGHPNIVDVFGFGQLYDGRCYFVMEWLQGETLRERLLRPLPLAEALDILEQIATALEAAHEAGVLHRDLKPDNIFLVRDKTGPTKVKLVDFGIAKLQGSMGSSLDTTRTGVVMGTPQYISPEQARGEHVDFAADIYSLGVVAYEMCTGDKLFKASSAVEVMAKHVAEPAPSASIRAPHLPPVLDQLIATMLAKDPTVRPTSTALRGQLAEIRAQLDAAAAVPTIRPPERPARRSRRAVVIAAAAAAGICAGIVALAMTSRASESPVAPPPKVDPPPVAMAVPPAPPPPAPAPASVEPEAVEPVKPVAVAHPAVKAKVASVTIKLEGAPRAQISVDGKVVADGVAKATIDLAPGRHKVRAEAAGHVPASAIVQVGAKDETVKLTLEPRKSNNSVYDPFAE